MSEIRSTPVLLYCILLVMILNTIWTFAALVNPPDTNSTKTAVHIECILHADNPAVHDFCVQKGYDK